MSSWRALRVGIALLWLGFAGCGEGNPHAMPEPDLSSAEEAVRRAVEQAQRGVRSAPADATAWGGLGDRYRVEGWRSEAASCYREAERLEPTRFRWPYRLGLSLRADDPERAAGALARAIALDDGYAPAHLHQALTLTALGRFDEAGRQFEQAHRLDPQSAPALLGLGQLALSDGRIDEARTHLSRSLELDPSDGRTHLALAQTAQILGDRDLADRHAQLARRLLRPVRIEDPRDRAEVESVSIAQLTRSGRILLTDGKPEEALPYLQEAIRRDPEAETPRLALGLALVMLGRLDEAEPQLRQAVSLAPLRPTTRAALGKFLLLNRNLPAGAEAELLEAVRLDPDDLKTRMHLGLAQAASGSLAESEKTFEAILEREPLFFPARYRLASVLAATGRGVEAERKLRENIRRIESAASGAPGPGTLPAEQARILLTDSESALGFLLLESGRATDAASWFRRALERRSDHAASQLGLASALTQAGDREAARAAYEQALRLRPGWPDALRGLSDLDQAE